MNQHERDKEADGGNQPEWRKRTGTDIKPAKRYEEEKYHKANIAYGTMPALQQADCFLTFSQTSLCLSQGVICGFIHLAHSLPEGRIWRRGSRIALSDRA